MHGTTADLKTSVKEIKKQIERKKPTNSKCHFLLGICGVLFLDVPSCFQSPQPPTTPVFLKLPLHPRSTSPLNPRSTSTQFCLWDLGVWVSAADGSHGCCCFPSRLICFFSGSTFDHLVFKRFLCFIVLLYNYFFDLKMRREMKFEWK